MSRLRSNKALVKVKPYYKILSYGAGSYKEGLHMRLMEKLEKYNCSSILNLGKLSIKQSFVHHTRTVTSG